MSAKDEAQELLKHEYEHKDDNGNFGKRVINPPRGVEFKKETFYKPKTGGFNSISIVPFRISEDSKLFKDRRGKITYKVSLHIHRFVGPSKDNFICLSKHLGQPCPICEKREELGNERGWDDETVKALAPKERVWYNVLNEDATTPTVQIFEEAHFLFEKKLLVSAMTRSGELIPFFLQSEPKTIEFQAFEKKSSKGKFTEYESLRFVERAPYSDKLIMSVFPLEAMVYIPTYEEVRNSLCGLEEESAPPQEERKKEEPKQERTPADEVFGDDSAVPSGDRKKKTPEEETKCPEGLKFGIDCDEYRGCAKCPKEVWKECSLVKEKRG